MSDLEVLQYTFEKQSTAAFQQCAAELPTQSWLNVMDKKRTMRCLGGLVGISCGIPHYFPTEGLLVRTSHAHTYTHMWGVRADSRASALSRMHICERIEVPRVK